MGATESKHTDLCDEVRSVSSESPSDSDVIGDYIMSFEYVNASLKTHKEPDKNRLT